MRVAVSVGGSECEGRSERDGIECEGGSECGWECEGW